MRISGIVVVSSIAIPEKVSLSSLFGGLGSTVVASPAGGARGPGFESRWRLIISVRGIDGICKYLPYFSSYLMLIMRAFVVSVCIN